MMWCGVITSSGVMKNYMMQGMVYSPAKDEDF